MLLLISSLVLVLIIVLSYLADRNYPTKRKFIIPLGILSMIAVMAFTTWKYPLDKAVKLTAQERILIMTEQPYFTEWYEQYKQQLGPLDRFATGYHRIIRDYKSQQISANTAITLLQNLYQESNAFDRNLQHLQVPPQLSKKNTVLVTAVIKKTKVYSYQLNETIRQSISVLHTGINDGLSHKVTSNNLTRIYALESPVMLDISQEIGQLNDNLTLP